MGIELGQVIRINRLKSNMTQADLAKGIISVSYLSKIENGTAQPPAEVIQMLVEKLQLDITDTIHDDINDKILQWFLYLLHGKKEKSTNLYQQIKDKLSNTIDKQLFYLVELHQFYYYVLIKNEQEAEKLYTSLQKTSKKFNDLETYYYHKFNGHYYYSRLSYKQALLSFQEAEKYIKAELFHRLEEINHLYYMIANAASKSRQTHLALLYSIRALDYYQSNYDLEKCAECHVLLGISYRRIKHFTLAEESLNYAIKLAKKIERKETLRLCHQNLGKLFSSINNPVKAIDHYTKSYDLRKDSPSHLRLVPISSLMKEYYFIGDMDNARKWLKKGHNLSESLKPEDSVYVYEFLVYEHLINGIGNTFEELIIDRIIPFFSEKELYHELAKYLNILAKYYFDNRKYKLAATYYKQLSNLKLS